MRQLPGLLLVAALAWAMASRGDASTPHLAVVVALLLAACIASGRRPAVPRATGAALALVLAWLVVAGPVRFGVDVDSARVPALLTVVVLTVQAATTLNDDSRTTVLRGITLVGCGQAALAVVQVGRAGFDPVPVRVAGSVGSANGLGVLLVVTLALIVRDARTAPTWLTCTVVPLVLAALAATQSRVGIALGALVLLGWSVVSRGRAAALLTAFAGVIGVAVLRLRSATEPPDQRLHLWAAALDRIRSAPLAGLGPEPVVYPMVAGGRPTTHAHNEVLQLTAEYGTVGLVLVLVLVLLVARDAHVVRRRVDVWLGAATAAVIVAGLVDFTLRLTSMTLLVALVGTLALAGRRTVSPHPHVDT